MSSTCENHTYPLDVNCIPIWFWLDLRLLLGGLFAVITFCTVVEVSAVCSPNPT
jgi:hypothetical protein